MPNHYLSMRKEMLGAIQKTFGTFPLDNVSDAFDWVGHFESVVNSQFSRTTDLQAAVRDGEYGTEGRGELVLKLDCFYEALDEFAEATISEAQHDVDEMISTGLVDYEDEDEDVEEKQELMDELEGLLGNLEGAFDYLEISTKNPDLETCG